MIVIGRGQLRPRCKICAKGHGLLQFMQQNFYSLHVIFEWNDKAFMNWFRHGLKDDVKDLLIIMPKLETMQEFITQAITCDNQLFERRQEKRFGWGNTNHIMISISSTLEKNASGLDLYRLMQLDISHHRKEEKTDVVGKGYVIIVAVQNIGY
jgi:hypothetical protein